VLVTIGENDPLVPQSYVRVCFDATGGPKTLEIVQNGSHQLMLHHTDQYVTSVDSWIRKQLPQKQNAV
jgi:pimeloyl-ACP methyl ester carboxylesterase